MIIDANALIHRSYHALPALTSPKGEPVGALYGLCLTLLNVLKTFKPTHIAAAFDRPEKTFRHKEYADYKGGRKEADVELVKQIIRAREVFAAFGIPVLEMPGFEADDIVGTLSNEAASKKVDAVIVTGDQDALQLVSPKVSVFMLKRGIKDTVTMGPEEVVERYGLKPEQMVDYKALRGDPSDNIPGVPGIGEKTATQLLQKFRTVKELYGHIDEVPEKVKKKLLDGKDKADLSFRLAKINLEVPLDVKTEDLVWKSYQREKVVELLREFGFSSLLSRIPDTDKGFQQAVAKRSQGTLLEEGEKAPRKTQGYEVISSKEHAVQLVGELKKAREFALDVQEIQGKLWGMSICFEEGHAWYVPAEYLAYFSGIISDPKVAKVGHNIKEDAKILKKRGYDLRPLDFDSMVASYVLNPNSRAHGLESLVFTVFGREIHPVENLFKRRNGKDDTEVTLAEVADYSCEIADYGLRLARHLGNELEKEKSLQKVFKEIDMPLVPVLVHMEAVGVKLDNQLLKRLSLKLGKRLSVLESDIYKLAGEEFNINSPGQLREILFTKLGLSTVGIGRIQSGLSTAADELEKLEDKHEIVKKIQEYREVAKLKNTYLDTLPKLVNKETERLHTTFHQTVTATGRLSSSDPNLQNIPIRTEIGSEIRAAFTAEKGFSLVAVDYSQIELRIAAHVAKDKVMQQAFREGKDIHAETAAVAYKVPLNEVTKEQRRQAKVLNFGVLYGMGPQAFARASGVSLSEAQALIDEYMRTYRGIAEYMEEAKALAVTQGYLETMFGRRSYLPEIKSGNPQIRSAAERAAFNHPIQGAESDIIKRAMIAIYKKVSNSENPYQNVRLILQVHDEFVFEVPEGQEKDFIEEIKPLLQGLENLSVPLVVDLKVGKNWGEMTKI